FQTIATKGLPPARLVCGDGQMLSECDQQRPGRDEFVRVWHAQDRTSCAPPAAIRIHGSRAPEFRIPGRGNRCLDSTAKGRRPRILLRNSDAAVLLWTGESVERMPKRAGTGGGARHVGRRVTDRVGEAERSGDDGDRCAVTDPETRSGPCDWAP